LETGMDFKASPISLIARLIGIVVLFHGLMSAFSLLAVSQPDAAPVLLQGGAEAFFLSLAIIFARLAAAVGLWTYSIWGAIVVAGAYGLEVLLFFFAPGLVEFGFFGFLMRLSVLGSVVLLLAFERLQRQRASNEI
jgi:hypothetical protein